MNMTCQNQPCLLQLQLAWLQNWRAILYTALYEFWLLLSKLSKLATCVAALCPKEEVHMHVSFATTWKQRHGLTKPSHTDTDVTY